MKIRRGFLEVTASPQARSGAESTSRFRILFGTVKEMVGNLAIANMDYEDFSRSAHGDPQGFHRGFLAPE
nr:hypothetical protein [Streptomyces chartreusis]